MAVNATSYVGSVRAGPLTIRITPKLTGRPFSALLGYAVGLPVSLLPDHGRASHHVGVSGFNRLPAGIRGLTLAHPRHPSHVPDTAGLVAQPAGPDPLLASCAWTADDSDFAVAGSTSGHENVLPNRVLLAGLELGGRLAVPSRGPKHVSCDSSPRWQSVSNQYR